MNLRLSGYEPTELPDCSTPRLRWKSNTGYPVPNSATPWCGPEGAKFDDFRRRSITSPMKKQGIFTRLRRVIFGRLTTHINSTTPCPYCWDWRFTQLSCRAPRTYNTRHRFTPRLGFYGIPGNPSRFAREKTPCRRPALRAQSLIVPRYVEDLRPRRGRGQAQLRHEDVRLHRSRVPDRRSTMSRLRHKPMMCTHKICKAFCRIRTDDRRITNAML